MSGLPQDKGVDLPPDSDGEDGDDTTSAEAGPPASQEEPAGHDAEDRTVQQPVASPELAHKPATPAPPPIAAPTLASPGAPPTQAVPSAPAPTTQPSATAAAVAAVRPAAGSTTEAETSGDELAAEDLEEEDLEEDDEEPLEDSITATAPRLNAASLIQAVTGASLPITLQGSVEIRSVDPDDEMMDETEVRTMPGHIPLHVPAAPRGMPAPKPAPSQPPPPVRPAAGRPPEVAPVSDTAADNESDDDGVTTQAQAPRVGSVPELAAVMALSAKPPSSAPVSTEPSPVDDDSVAEAPTRPGVEGEDEPPTRPGVESAEGAADHDPPTRPGVNEPPTRPGLGVAPEPETAKRAVPVGSYANEDDEDDESVTTRARGRTYTGTGESITTKGSQSAAIAAALDDGTDGTTQKVKRTAASGESPADGEAESITTQAPGPLTNILRVIASGSSPSLEDSGAMPPIDDEEEAPENRTAVMANAPLKRVIAELTSSSLPAIRPTGGPLVHGPQGSAAPQLEPSSESGLRIARAGSGDHASAGALGIADGRASGIVANAMASDGSVSGPIDLRAHAAMEMGFPSGTPSLHDVDLGKGPRYGLLVGIVAVISIIVPVTLFIALRHNGSDAVSTAQPAEPASEIESTDPARAKAARNRNGSYVVPTASASASSKTGPTKPGGSLRR